LGEILTRIRSGIVRVVKVKRVYVVLLAAQREVALYKGRGRNWKVARVVKIQKKVARVSLGKWIQTTPPCEWQGTNCRLHFE
jgi:hypothetical protein